MNEFKITIDMLVDVLNALTDDDFGAPCEDDEFGMYGTRYAHRNERIENIDIMASAFDQSWWSLLTGITSVSFVNTVSEYMQASRTVSVGSQDTLNFC